MKQMKNSSPAYETRDAHFRPLIITGVGLVGLMFLILLVVWGVFGLLEERSPQPGGFPETFVEPRTAPPEPTLQPNPRADMLVLRAREDSLLSRYSWIDREAGMAAIPIDSAMQRVLRRGFPTRRSEGRP